MSIQAMRIACLGLLVIFLCVSCREKHDHEGKTPLVEVGENFLYFEDLQGALPSGLSKEDSVLFSEQYIRHWIEETLLYDKAQDNISDNETLDRQVANYRKALVMHAYQQALIDQKLTKEISEDELQAYYQNNPELFKVERPLIKGLFIKVPLTAPRLAEVRRWYKQEEGEAVEKLEKYSLQHAVKYEYFYDRWMPLAEIIGMLPLQGSDADAYIEKHRQVELKDTAFYYFLHVSDYRAVGDVAPYDYARRQVKEMLFNVKQVQYLEQVKDDLYQRAEEKNRIKKYY